MEYDGNHITPRTAALKLIRDLDEEFVSHYYFSAFVSTKLMLPAEPLSDRTLALVLFMTIL